MIIECISLKNFGLFKGENKIILKPSPEEGRNIIIISGQNGVGKTTLLEAIHLCLLGSLAVDSRISEQNYDHHLYKRAYKGDIEFGQLSSLDLTFEFTKSGQPVQYRVVRSWVNNPDNVNEEVYIYENGIEQTDLNKKEKNFFLRELIQPGFAKVMFFDGEKLSALFESHNLTSFIAESCRNLFGLNFIDQLKTDLNYYVNKLLSQKDTSKNVTELKKI